jgi:FkbM family methyltransferase
MQIPNIHNFYQFLSKKNLLNDFIRNKFINFIFRERHTPYKKFRKYFINNKYFIDIYIDIYDYSHVLQATKPEYESEIFLFYLKKLNKNHLFIDIGSNIGLHSFFVRKFLNIKNIYSVEPNLKCIFLQKKTISSNKNLKIKIINKLITSLTNNVLVQINNNTGSGTINNDFGKDAPLAFNLNNSKVATISPSKFIKNIRKKNLMSDFVIKLDIQGSEYNFLEDIKNILIHENYIKFIVFEINNKNFHLLKNLIIKLKTRFILTDLSMKLIEINFLPINKLLKRNLLLSAY